MICCLLVQMHKSIIRKDAYLKRTLLSSGFGCPLCPNFKTESDEVIQRHLSNHSANAVIFQDKFCICRCNLSCRAGGHFHCPFCDGTIMRKDDMVSHLYVCPNECKMIQPSLVDSCKSPSPETSPHEVNQRHLRNHNANEVLFKGFYMLFGSSNVIQPTLEKCCEPSSTETQSLKEDLSPVHKSIIRKDAYLKRTLLSSGFGCPLCPNFQTESDEVIQRHLRNHNTNAIIFQDKFCICRCKLFCHFEGHFHCPFCGGTVTKKKDMTFHLTTCPNKSNVIQPTLENSSADHSYRQAASPKTLTPATDFDQTTATTSEKPTIQEREVILPLTKAESDEVIQKLLRNHNANAVHFQDLSSRVGGHFHPSFCDSTITTKDLMFHLTTCPDKSNVIQPTLVESYKFCVCRCNSSADHFHCPFCDDTIIRKEDMILHLNVCPNKNKSTQSTLVESADHSYAKAALPKTPTPVTDFDQTTPATTSDQLMIQEEEVTVPLTNVHESVIRNDTDLKQSLLTSGFECPLCPDFKTQSDRVIQTHLSNHIANGVHFQENVVCRCNLPCRAGGHFHCLFCDKTLINKDSMALHLIRCQNKSTVVQFPLVEASPEPFTQPLIDPLEPSGSEDHSVSSQTADHAYTQTPTLITALNQTTPATTSDALMIQEEEITLPLSKAESDEVIQKVLRNHNANAVPFQDLSSRVGGHFHRPFCDSTIPTKDVMFHLTTCPDKSNVIQPTLVESSGDHSYTKTASCKTPTPATDFDQTTLATTSEQPTIQEGEGTPPLTNVHKSVIREDTYLERTLLPSGFGCPLCPHFKTESDEVIQSHLSNHSANAVIFEDKFCVCRCNSSADHFHCPFCDDTIFRKEDMILHLNVCPNENQSTQSTLVESDHSYAKAALPKTPTPVTDFDQTTPATTSDQLMIQEEEVTVPLTNVHESVIRNDTDLKQSLLTSGFECPLCPNFKTQSDRVIQTHLSNHIANGVHFQENVICRCNLPCRAGGHFHCLFCDKTLTNKDSMALHLIRCQNKSTVVQPALVEPPPETQPLIDPLEPSGSEDHSVSSQTADHAFTQTPTLITAFDQTTPATTSDQLMVQDVEVHKSITWKDTYLERTLLPSGFGCPLCPYFNTVNDDVIERHLRNHNENGVHFQEIIVCRCNLSCRVKSHFHCPFCDSTIIRKDNVPLHLKECHENSPLDLRKLLVSCKPSLPETQPFKDILEPSVNEDHYTSSQTADYSYSQTAPLETPTFATEFDQRAPATSTDQPMIEEEEVTVPKAHVKCPHCPLVLYRQNLAVHIKRKHSKLEDIAEKSQLKSSCTDQSKDSKASHGLSVQPKAWSLQHHTKSEMKVCCQHHLLFQHSGLSHSMCHRICSGDYLSSMAPMPLTNTKFSMKWRKTRLHYVNIAML
ncbi:uncharacterized protein [Nothobranchius furzeri]|uniref:uncharacterized protein isoform X3 n=1 Tax=Nothobranchius furzeri TaxID=105023 RepID=UPI003904C0AF